MVEGSTDYDYEQVEPQADALADSKESDYFVDDESCESDAMAESATTDAIPAIESCPMAIMQIDPNDSRYSSVPEQAAEEVEDELGMDGINLAREVGYTVVGRVAESMHATGNWLQQNAKWLDKFNREIIANQSGNIR